MSLRQILMAVAAVAAVVPTGVAAGFSEADIFFEGFEGGAVPPAGWTVTDTNPTFNWQVTNAPSAVLDGTYAAFVNFDATLQQDEWLRSPVIDLPASSTLTLQFWALSNTNFCPFEGATTSVIVTDASDVPLDTVWDMCADQSWSDFRYRLVSVDLSGFQGQSVKLAWRYVGIDGQSFGLDNIVVTSVPIPDIFADGFESGNLSQWSSSVP